jgi:hypothetical protein
MLERSQTATRIKCKLKVWIHSLRIFVNVFENPQQTGGKILTF